jgi:hypothetical protein
MECRQALIDPPPEFLLLSGVLNIRDILAKPILTCNFGDVIASLAILYVLKLRVVFALINLQQDTSNFVNILHGAREPWNPEWPCLLDENALILEIYLGILEIEVMVPLI